MIVSCSSVDRLGSVCSLFSGDCFGYFPINGLGQHWTGGPQKGLLWLWLSLFCLAHATWLPAAAFRVVQRPELVG
jgi:hypothetical protein